MEMKKIVLVLCTLCFSAAYAALTPPVDAVGIVVENLEGYADTADLLANGSLYLPTSLTGQTAELNVGDAFDGSKSVKFIAPDYGTGSKGLTFGWRYTGAPFAANKDFRGYDIVRFHFKGDPSNNPCDIQFRISDRYATLIAMVTVPAATTASEWSYVDVPLGTSTLLQYVGYVWCNGTKVNVTDTVIFNLDRIELLKSPFASAVQAYYSGDPFEFQLSWFPRVTDDVDEAYLRWAPVGQILENEIVLTEPNSPFTGLIAVNPASDYDYEIEMNGWKNSGTFKSAYLDSVTWVIEDFESYTDTVDMLANANLYLPLVYGYTPSTAVLETQTPYDGAQCGKFVRTGYPNYTLFGFDFIGDGGIDLSGYDKIRVWFRGSASNPIPASPTDSGVLKLQVLDVNLTQFVNNIYPGKAAVIEGWTCMEYNIDSDAKWSNVGVINFHGRKDNYGTITVWLDRLEAVKEIELPGDIDGDYAVNHTDLGMIVSDWLTDNTAVAGASSMLEDLEAGLSDWSLYYNSTAPSTITALTSGAAQGSGALKWDYDVTTSVGNVYAEILYTLDTPVNLSQYDRVNIKVKRYLTNSSESSVYVKFLDGGLTNANLSGKTYLPGATVASDEQWQIWTIDLHNLNYSDGGTTYTKLSDITNVQGIMFGVIGNAGTGTIEMDAIELAMMPECSAAIDTDLNGDCVVNLLDYAIVASNWLVDYK